MTWTYAGAELGGSHGPPPPQSFFEILLNFYIWPLLILLITSWLSQVKFLGSQVYKFVSRGIYPNQKNYKYCVWLSAKIHPVGSWVEFVPNPENLF